MNKIPVQVNLLDQPADYKYFDMSIKTAILDCLKKGKLRIAWARLCAGLIFKSEKNKARCEQRVWKYISKSLTAVNKNYDTAIGYLEKNPIYFAVDKVKALKKLGWVHTNYTSFGMDGSLDEPYFRQLDHIITVSEECAKSLQQHFLDQKDKIKVIHNIVSPQIIYHLANSEIQEEDMFFHKGFIHMITIARLSYVKGIDFAIEACKILVDGGYKIRWYVLGLGTDKEKLQHMSLIKEYNLEETFILMGVRDNPYPFIKYADIYIQPSRFEGKSIAVDEAKIMHKPIVITNFSTATDQIDHEENGLIVEMNPEAIAEGIQRIINDVELRKKLTHQLSTENLGTEAEIEKLYELIL